MGNTQAIKQTLHSPRGADQLHAAAAHLPDCEVQTWVKLLLSGTIPSNFSYEDMCRHFDGLTSPEFVIIPTWPLNMQNTQTSALAILRHWPTWTVEQRQDPSFLRRVRVMCPLFKRGDPIGHARFMFMDRWQPMPLETLQDEAAEWQEVLQEFIPVSDIVSCILFEYEGLDPTMHLGRCSIKIIDSLMGQDTSPFADDAMALHDVFRSINDQSWSPATRHDISEKVESVRMFLSVQEIDRDMEVTLLPSTMQTGLECIIITLCRVIATWVQPRAIPLRNCTELCTDQKGRRILSEVLLLSHRGDPLSIDVPAALRCSDQSTPSGKAPALSKSDHVDPPPSDNAPPSSPRCESGNAPSSTPQSGQSTWYTVYDKPTFRVLSRHRDYVPHTMRFSGTEAYHVYRGCRWIHTSREQDFVAKESVLTYGKQLGTLFMCPVRNLVEQQWYFILLGQPGFAMLKSSGRGGPVRTHFQNAEKVFDEVKWCPPDKSDEDFEKFLESLPDPTWKATGSHMLCDPPSSSVVKSSSTPTSSASDGLRRSTRKRTPRRQMTWKQQVVCTIYECLLYYRAEILLFIFRNARDPQEHRIRIARHARNRYMHI